MDGRTDAGTEAAGNMETTHPPFFQMLGENPGDEIPGSRIRGLEAGTLRSQTLAPGGGTPGSSSRESRSSTQRPGGGFGVPLTRPDGRKSGSRL